MLCNCNYNKTKVLYKLSALATFIDKHAVRDAEKDGHPLCGQEFIELKHDVEKHMEKIREAIEGLSKENKFG